MHVYVYRDTTIRALTYFLNLANKKARSFVRAGFGTDIHMKLFDHSVSRGKYSATN